MKIPANMMLQTAGQDRGAQSGALSAIADFMDDTSEKRKEFFSALQRLEKRPQHSLGKNEGSSGFSEPLARLESLITKVAEMKLEGAELQQLPGVDLEQGAIQTDQTGPNEAVAASDMGQPTADGSEMVIDKSKAEHDGLDAIVLELLTLGRDNLAQIQEVAAGDALSQGADIADSQELKWDDYNAGAAKVPTPAVAQIDVANRIEALTHDLKAQQQGVQSAVAEAVETGPKSAAAEMMQLVAQVDKQMDKVTSVLRTDVSAAIAAQVGVRSDPGASQRSMPAQAKAGNANRIATTGVNPSADQSNIQVSESRISPVEQTAGSERSAFDGSNTLKREQYSARTDNVYSGRENVGSIQSNNAASQNVSQSITSGPTTGTSMAKDISAQLARHLNTELLTMELRPAIAVDRTVSVNMTTSVLTLQLHPVGLGRVQAEIRREGDLVKIKLTVEAPDTLEIIKSDLDSLKTAMRALGTADGDVTLTQGNLSRLTSDANGTSQNLFSNERQSEADLDGRQSQKGGNASGQSSGDEEGVGPGGNLSRNPLPGDDIIYI